MKGKFDLEAKFDKATEDNYFISEITLAELKFGIEKSENSEKNKKALDNFLSGIQILPIFHYTSYCSINFKPKLLSVVLCNSQSV